jgi:propanol-preferring alcohol dehydrogenase
MILPQTGLLSENPTPLCLVDWPQPVPKMGQVLVQVSVCGVCHTELDEIEGRTPPPKLPVILGHQVIGKVVETGPRVNRLSVGDRVGIGWIFRSDGTNEENVSPEFQATGRDANGGYAEFMVAHQDYAFPIPICFTDREAAPLLCAGSIGYRALRLTGLQDGQPLGLTGFGGSAHLVIQLAKHRFPGSSVYVFARNPAERDFARELGAEWAGDTMDLAPEPLAAVIDTTPVWTPIVQALANLRPGGRLVINAIRKQDSDKNVLQSLSYERHLWMEREIKTVANITGQDIAEFLSTAAEIPIRPRTRSYRLEDANRALMELKTGAIEGAKVLEIDSRQE